MITFLRIRMSFKSRYLRSCVSGRLCQGAGYVLGLAMIQR